MLWQGAALKLRRTDPGLATRLVLRSAGGDHEDSVVLELADRPGTAVGLHDGKFLEHMHPLRCERCVVVIGMPCIKRTHMATGGCDARSMFAVSLLLKELAS